MTDEEFTNLLAGPLAHPYVPFLITRLALALRYVVEQGGDPAAEALRRYCRDRQDLGDEVAEGPDEP